MTRIPTSGQFSSNRKTVPKEMYFELQDENKKLEAEIARLRKFMESRTLDGEHTELEVYLAE